MMYYFLQSSLLLLLTYFIGCAIGCMLRSMVREEQPLAVRHSGQRPPVAVEPAPVAAMPAWTPRVTAPVNETFRRADTGSVPQVAAPQATVQQATVAQAAAPVPPPIARPAVPPPVPAPAPVAAERPSMAATAAVVTVTAAAAAAAAAAIAHGRARDVAAAKPASTPPVPAVPAPVVARVEVPQVAPRPAVVMPAAGASSGMSGVAVGGEMKAAAGAAVGDDLKRIRGVGPEIETALQRVGIRRYAEIAGWSASDVDQISKSLGLKGRIEHENWIEQAQVLSKGGETAFSRRYDRGDMETVPAPRPQAAVVASPVAQVAPPAAPALAVAGATAVTAGAVAAAAAAAERAKAAAAAVVQSTAAQPDARQPVINQAADRVKEFTGILTGAVPAVSAPPAPAPAASTGDDLTRIRGIDGDMAKQLGDRGITRFAQIGTLTPADADSIGAGLSLRVGRIQQEGWIDQARLLAGMEPAPAQPAARADGADGAGTPSWHQKEPAVDWTPERTAAAAAATAAAQTVAATVPNGAGARVVRSGVPDDLKRIKGIGVVLEKKLHGLGVINYAQIAGWSQGEIDKMSDVLDFKGRIERENWIEQARILSSGGITDFARRVDRGEVETSKPRPVR